MILAIDFDGVVHDLKHPVPGRRMGPPIEGTQAALNSFKADGHKVIIFTVWGDDKGSKTISDFMNYYHLPFDEITNIKPKADYYIDDHGLKFTNWGDICETI